MHRRATWHHLIDQRLASADQSQAFLGSGTEPVLVGQTRAPRATVGRRRTRIGGIFYDAHRDLPL